jgi:hypothetical protein
MGDSPSLIDYTALEKRGIIKKKEVKKMAAPVSKDGFIDFSAMGQDKINQIVNSQQQSPSLMSSMPSLISSAIQSPQSPVSSTSNSSPTPGFTSFWDQLPGQTSEQTQSSISTPLAVTDNLDVLTLKVKIDDLEYKLARLTEKLDLISSKL